MDIERLKDIASAHRVCRPVVDEDIGTHEGIENVELAAMLDLHAAKLDSKGMYGAAHDIREAARRLVK